MLKFGLSYENVDLSSERNAKWVEDIRELNEELPQKHGNLFLNISREEFESQIENLIRDIPVLNDFEIQIRIKEIFARVNDAHLMLLNFQSDIQSLYNCPTFFSIYFKMGLKSIFPIKVYWFGNDLRVIEADKEYKKALGSKLTAINNIPIDDVMKKINTLITHNNIHRLRFLNVMHLVHPHILKYFNLCSDGKAAYTFMDDNGKHYTIEVREKRIEDVIFISAMDKSKGAPIYMHTDDAYWYEYLPEEKILYARIRMFCDKDKKFLDLTEQYFDIKQTYEDFLNELYTFIDTNEIEKLVIDFRDNNGGVPGPSIAEEIKIRDKINQKGKLFIMVNRGTFSAPIKHSGYFKESTNALFFGEPTGEMPYKGGPANFNKLTNSNLYIAYSKNIFEHLYEGVDTIEPDYKIESNFNDYINGIDTVFEEIRNYR